MNAKIKVFGLALVATLAMSALAAAGAAAEPEFEAEAESVVTVTGEQYETGEHPDHVLSLGGNELTCEKALFEGTLDPNPDPSLTLTPTYSDCSWKVGGGLPATVTHNECDFTLYGGEQTPEDENHYDNADIDIVCPEGKAIVIHTYIDAEAHKNNESLCTIEIGPQTLEDANTYTNTTEGVHDVDVTTTAKVQIDVEGPILLCGASQVEGDYTGATTLRAYSDQAHKNQVGLTVVG